MTKIVCWNINRNNKRAWKELRKMEDADVALLQEAGTPPPDLNRPDRIGPQAPWEPWDEKLFDRKAYKWGTAIVKLSDRVEVKWFRRVFLNRAAKKDEIAVSEIGTIAAAKVIPCEGKQFIAFSLIVDDTHEPHDEAHRIIPEKKWGYRKFDTYQDGSAHRIISDLSAFIGSKDPSTHRILAAGDFNTILGAKESSPLALPARDWTIFDRMNALGFKLMGPQYPNGWQADPPSTDVPEDTRNVPTFYSIPHKQSPKTARNQLDYVFASRGFHGSVSVRAMNGEDEWGASDHCRLCIKVE